MNAHQRRLANRELIAQWPAGADVVWNAYQRTGPGESRHLGPASADLPGVVQRVSTAPSIGPRKVLVRLCQSRLRWCRPSELRRV